MVWYNPLWVYRVKVTVDHTKVPNTDQLNYPVLVTEANMSDAFWGHVKSDGTDVVVTQSDGLTKLKRELVGIDVGGKKLELWAKVPTLSYSEDTTVYLYYGNAAASETNDVDAWDANFKFVSHMRDDPDTSHIKDSTTYANDGAKEASGEPAVTPNGTIDDAQDFTPTDFINCGHSAVLDLPGIITVEACVELNEIAGTHNIISKTGPTYQDTTYWMDIRTNATAIYFGGYTPEGAPAYLGQSYTFSTGVKYHVAGVDTGDQLQIYVNGDLLGTGGRANRASDATWDVRLGVRGIIGNPVNAIVDEVRISGADAPRSADWLKTCSNNQQDPASFYSVGAEETPFVVGIVNLQFVGKEKVLDMSEKEKPIDLADKAKKLRLAGKKT